MIGRRTVGVTTLILLTSGVLPAQEPNPMDLAREAIEDGNFFEVIEILTPEIGDNPSPEAYLTLGLALANIGQYDRALELFTEAVERYPTDSRFHDEIAGVHLANRDVDLATESLRRALTVNPADRYAADLLASIELSEGDVRQALEIWNAVEQPELAEIVQNFSPGYLDRIVPTSLAFGPGDVLRYGRWRTTQARLFGSQLYSNVGLELEPSPREELYDAIVRTSPLNNTRQDIAVDLFRGIPAETVYLELWDIARTGLSWQSNFRWDEDRRRLEGRFFIPLPLPGLPVLELRDTWRSENWDLSEPIRGPFASDAEFQYKVNSLAFNIGAVPHYRIELSGGLEYRNRDVTGTIPALAMDDRNSGAFNVGAIVRTFDARYKNQLRGRGFLARESVLGDFDFSGGSAQIANRFLINDDTLVDFSITGGTMRGDIPVDHYFVLGLGNTAQHKLRGHVASDRGVYGRSPMGTDFVLVNTDIQYRLTTIPMFNTLSIPYIDLKAMAFFDAAKTFDRNRIFRQDLWYEDVGTGLRFETPTMSFTLLYGRDTEAGVNNWYFYSEPRLW